MKLLMRWLVLISATHLSMTELRLACGADRSLQDFPDLAAFFEAEVSRIETQNSLRQFETLDQWTAARPKLRSQLFEMLGLSPLPEKTPLQPQITGVTEEAEFRVERLHFQSLPGLYVTGNLYLPKALDQPVPAVLYVCGHGGVKKDGVSFGNKVQYQHHGAWFARSGFACLVIDTLQLGEIEGIHHGTYRHDRWWWNARGYTPAGVEAWNCIRALDYLQGRPEIDGQRLGVTGRSGGGAYSWWIAALDDRIQSAVPVAGITTLRNHVVDGCVEGHCDCMYMLNSCRWDYATVAALVAPRPLLISNTDKDSIFPLEGVQQIHRDVRHIYELYDKPQHLGLQITEGPHKDTQELHIHAFRWMNRFLKNDESMISKVATPFFQPEQLKVFSSLPVDERNTRIDESFVAAAVPPAAEHVSQITKNPEQWFGNSRTMLRSRCFAAWPDGDPDWQPKPDMRIEKLIVREDAADRMTVSRIHFDSQRFVPLFLDVICHPQAEISSVSNLRLLVLDTEEWSAWNSLLNRPDAGLAEPSAEQKARMIDRLRSVAALPGSAVALFSPRGSGPHRWQADARKLVHIQRRFQLLGMTVEGMQAWDIRRALQTVRSMCRADAAVSLYSTGRFDEPCLCASLFEPALHSLHLAGTSGNSHPVTPILNLSRTVHAQELFALALWQTSIQPGQASVVSELGGRLSASPEWRGGALLTAPQ